MHVHLELSVAVAVVGEVLELVFSLRAEAALTLSRAGLQGREFGQEVLRVVCLVQLRLVGRRRCLVGNLLPVDGFEPGVRLDLLCVGWAAAKPLIRVLVQQLNAQIAGVIGPDVVVKFRLRVLDVLV